MGNASAFAGLKGNELSPEELKKVWAKTNKDKDAKLDQKEAEQLVKQVIEHSYKTQCKTVEENHKNATKSIEEAAKAMIEQVCCFTSSFVVFAAREGMDGSHKRLSPLCKQERRGRCIGGTRVSQAHMGKAPIVYSFD
jgi:hypothetical protein